MTSPSRISVVVPVLDEAARIGGCLRALARQDLHEVIVVDGGSRDSTRELVASAPNVTLMEARRGRAVQMNAGAGRATGDVLLFLHADVSLPEDAASRIRATLAMPETVAGAFRTWTVPGPNDRDPWWSPLLHLADLRSRYSCIPYGDQALFLRRQTFVDSGGFADIPLMEDLELSRRLSRRGRIRVAPACVTVLGRRFLERPIFYTTLVNIFPLLYRCGVSPRWLAQIYGAVR